MKKTGTKSFQKKKNRKKIKNKLHFVQNWGTYENDTFVFIGYSRKEVENELCHYENEQPFIDSFNDELFDNNRGFMVCPDNRRTLLWMKEYIDTWEFWDVLIHEINHLVFYIFKEQRGMLEEMEAFAYQQQYLIKEIRKKLLKFYK